MLLVLPALLLFAGCETIRVLPPPSTIPENLLIKCEQIPKFSDVTEGNLIKDHIQYTVKLMELNADCAATKDQLIDAVRTVQKQKTK